MNAVKQIVREAHRRSLWQVLGVYIALAWGAYQVVKELTELFGLPDWVPGLGIVLLLIGLPVVLATAFIQEGAPGRRAEPQAADPIDPTLLPMRESAQPSEPPAAEAALSPHRHHLLFTWQRALIAGITAFLLLGITAGGYMGLRNAGVGPFGSLLASGELNAREPILIAEFTPLNGDSMLARTVTEAFRVDFAQTSSVTVVQPKRVQDALRRMSRDTDSRLDAELAHEVALRDNIKSYLVGELSQAGNRYVIAAKLYATRDGRILASFRETAANADDIIDAVDRLSKRLRNKIGESLKTIRAEKPLELVSTPSLEALQKYTQGAYAIDVQRDFDAGISLLEEAITLDSAFAMAWRKLAVAYGNSDASDDLRRRALLKAYSFRDRLPDIERYNTTGMYYYSMKRDYQKAVSAYEMLAERDPTWPPNNLGIVYMQLREPRKAVETFRRTIAVDSTLGQGYTNLVDAYIEVGVRDSAELAADVVRKRGDEFEARSKDVLIAAAFRDYEKVNALIAGSDALARTRFDRLRLLHARADLFMVQGRIRAFENARAQATAMEVERGNRVRELEAAIWRAVYAWIAEQNPTRARQLLDDAVRRYPLDRYPALDRPYNLLAGSYAILGDRARAEQYQRERDQNIPAELSTDTRDNNDFVAGALALNEKRFGEAITLWRGLAERDGCTICSDWELALAFEQAGMPDSAIARLEHFVQTPQSRSLWEDASELAVSYERLADLYAARGNTQKALLYAGKFVELWRNADPGLQPRVRAKHEMIRQLQKS